MVALYRRLSQELHQPLNLLQSWNRFWQITTISWIIGETDALYFHFHISVYLWVVDLDSRVTKKKAVLWDEILLKVIKCFVQGPYKQLGGLQKDSSSHWWIWWNAGHSSDLMLTSLDDIALPKWCLLSKSRSRPLFRRKQLPKMAEQLLLKVCSITFQCCDRYSQYSVDDRGRFHN